MSSTAAALPPPINHILHKSVYDDGIDVPEYSFSGDGFAAGANLSGRPAAETMPTAVSVQMASTTKLNTPIRHSRRPPTGPFLAKLGAGGADQPKDAGNRAATPQAQPFKSHPYLLPREVPPRLISQATEQVLEKYLAHLQQKGGTTPASIL